MSLVAPKGLDTIGTPGVNDIEALLGTWVRATFTRKYEAGLGVGTQEEAYIGRFLGWHCKHGHVLVFEGYTVTLEPGKAVAMRGINE